MEYGLSCEKQEYLFHRIPLRYKSHLSHWGGGGMICNSFAEFRKMFQIVKSIVCIVCVRIRNRGMSHVRKAGT